MTEETRKKLREEMRAELRKKMAWRRAFGSETEESLIDLLECRYQLGRSEGGKAQREADAESERFRNGN